MSLLTLSDIQALLDSLEPSGVSGFVPTSALKQLAATMRERNALEKTLREMTSGDPAIGAEWYRSAARGVLGKLESGELGR